MAVLTQVLLLLLACAAFRTALSTALSAAEPVRVEYYMEALCPYCANFTLTQLKPLFLNKLINYVELDIIPWGNAHVDVEAGGQVVCQHGQLECDLNKLLSCALAQHPMQDDWFPFLACVEEMVVSGKDIVVEEVAHACAVHAGMVTQKLLACYNGQLGSALQRLAAQRTASLQPPHRWVPWVTVNGVPLLDDVDNIQRYICAVIYYAHTSHDRPKACIETAKPSAAALIGQKQDKKEPHAKAGFAGRGSKFCKRATYKVDRLPVAE